MDGPNPMATSELTKVKQVSNLR